MTVSVPKLGAPVAIIPKDPEMMVSSIFKRKLMGIGGDRIQAKKTSRCLFGPPDPNVVIQQAHEVQQRMQQAFENRWGFSVTKGEPLIAQEAPKDEKIQSVVPKYEWVKVSRESETAVHETLKKPETQEYPKKSCIATCDRLERLQPSVSASVQTETSNVVTQGTQTSCSALAEYDLYVVARKRKSAPIPVPMKKERAFPRPLTMLPFSPDVPVLYDCVQSSSLESMTGEELMESHHDHEMSPISPLDACHGQSSPPRVRRNSTGEVFVFADNTAFEFQSLCIQNGSPARCYSAESKRMKQRCITDYMQVKKTKLNFSSKI